MIERREKKERERERTRGSPADTLSDPGTNSNPVTISIDWTREKGFKPQAGVAWVDGGGGGEREGEWRSEGKPMKKDRRRKGSTTSEGPERGRLVDLHGGDDGEQRA